MSKNTKTIKEPLDRIVRDTCHSNCNNCRSSNPRMGFSGLFGKRSCLNIKCKNHIKPEKSTNG
jgi:hypothetical protein